jgi:hypothetical protein
MSQAPRYSFYWLMLLVVVSVIFVLQLLVGSYPCIIL